VHILEQHLLYMYSFENDLSENDGYGSTHVGKPSQNNKRLFTVTCTISCIIYFIYGPGSSVGIATDYGLDGPGIESRWGEIFRNCPDRPWGPPDSCTIETGYFPGVKCGWGVLLTTHPLIMPRSLKSRAIPLPTFWATPVL
jgi:hypothetical protein